MDELQILIFSASRAVDTSVYTDIFMIIFNYLDSIPLIFFTLSLTLQVKVQFFIDSFEK
jgi:hypothetical protein